MIKYFDAQRYPQIWGSLAGGNIAAGGEMIGRDPSNWIGYAILIGSGLCLGWILDRR